MPPRAHREPRSPQRAAALVAVLALHLGAVVALAQYQPARGAMSHLPAVMVSLITPPKLEQPQDLPKPMPVVKQPIRKIEPLPPQPILATTEPTPVPARFDAPAPAPTPAAPPAPVAAAPPPAPAIPPNFTADYLNNPAPSYPALSRRMGEEGKVVLRVFVNQQGLPTQVQIRTSSGFSRLDDISLETVKQWKFMPARRGEQPIGAWVLVPISFSLGS